MPRRAPTHRPIPRRARVHQVVSLEPTVSWRTGKTTAERGYGGRWQKARKTFLSRPENVLCRMCSARGLLVLATVVDHRVPHRGDQMLFWDTSNWQPLCKRCHDSRKQAEDRASTTAGGRVESPGVRSS